MGHVVSNHIQNWTRNREILYLQKKIEIFLYRMTVKDENRDYSLGRREFLKNFINIFLILFHSIFLLNRDA